MSLRTTFASLALFFAATAFAQHPERATLDFQIKGLKNSIATLAYYYGGQAYRVDSVMVDTTSGRFVFQKNDLKPGVYFVVAGSERLLDFLLASPGDSFLVRGDYSRLDSLWVENSVENKVFFAFERERKKIESQIAAQDQMLNMVGRATKGDRKVLDPLYNQLERLFLSGDSLALAFIREQPDALYAKMLRSVRAPESPKNLRPTLPDGKPNPAYVRWMRAHYFDNTDFSDERLLRNNFWHKCFDDFFARHVAPLPDSLIGGIDEVMRKMPRHGAFYRFAAVRLSQYFEQNEAPGADRIFVHLVDQYLRKDDTPWLDIATLERLEYKADVHRPNLSGTLALNFSLPDETGKAHALYEVEAPISMLIFYSPLCDHCKELMPKIYQIYLDYLPKGIKAVAVNTDKQHVYWKNFVAQQGWEWLDLASPEGIGALEKQYAAFNLPVIYLLDKDKRILAKRVRAERLGELLGQLFGSAAKK